MKEQKTVCINGRQWIVLNEVPVNEKYPEPFLRFMGISTSSIVMELKTKTGKKQYESLRDDYGRYTKPLKVGDL